MGDHRKMGKAKLARLHNSRPTIGLLIGRLGDLGYAAHVWPGVADVAEERDVNLICFVGGALRAAHEFDSQRNVAYDLVSSEKVDGLVAMSGSIGQFIGPEQLRRFYERYHPLPMVNIAMALDGIPSVLVDNKTGMRDAITHLIEVHKLSRIAFIRGPETNPEAEQRYHTYAEVLAGHGLPLDPDLVAPGNYLSPAGVEAIRLLLDERKVNFEAVASANDEMALGALTSLRERGMRVPDDVCVVGFDDLEEARYATPPLTTIRQPLYEQGRRATEMLLALLAGEEAPEQTMLPTELVVRRSCGCLGHPALQAATAPVAWIGETLEATFTARREHILSEMVKAVDASVAGLDPGWAERLLDAFSITLKDLPSGAFLSALDEVLRQVGAEGGDVMQWQRVLSVLWQRALPSLADDEILSQAENLWQQARLLIGETTQWAQVYRRIQAERRAFEFTTRISEPLMTAFDVAGLTDVVAQQLPRMGIRGCYLSLYEQPAGGERETPTEWSRLILAYNEKGRIELEPGGRRFLSRQLVPGDILPHEKRCAVMLEPLHFRDEIQLGFILFEPLKTEAGALREALSRQISTALRGALLLQERKRAEEALHKEKEAQRFFSERLTRVLDTINELSTIESFDALCRQSVELAIERLGFDRVGLCFLSEDQQTVLGVYGTDETGHLRDEKHLRRPVKHTPTVKKLLESPEPVLFFEKEILYNDKLDQVGIGNHAVARLWNGEKIIGIYAVDNLLHQNPITDEDLKTLGLYGTAMGHLFTLKQADEALKEYSERLEEMVDERTKELREAQEQLVRREKLAVLGHLAATVSHEIRNPLATIRVSASAIDRNTRDKGLGVERALDRIQRNITRCDNIISELLDYTRMPELNLQSVHFDDWLNRVLDEQHLPEDVTLSQDIASGVEISLDPERFRRVIVNLVDNARQAVLTSPEASDKARVLGVQSRVVADRLKIVISDTGPGIPPDVMPHIFEPLYSTKGFGVGLGLSVVKGIVEQHGGEIEITSEVDKGTQVVVWLPLTR